MIHACGVGCASRWMTLIVMGEPVEPGFRRQLPCALSTFSGVAFVNRA
jgi:hypothetical protein